jgi:hypothetical protein
VNLFTIIVAESGGEMFRSDTKVKVARERLTTVEEATSIGRHSEADESECRTRRRKKRESVP